MTTDLDSDRQKSVDIGKMFSAVGSFLARAKTPLAIIVAASAMIWAGAVFMTDNKHAMQDMNKAMASMSERINKLEEAVIRQGNVMWEVKTQQAVTTRTLEIMQNKLDRLQ